MGDHRLEAGHATKCATAALKGAGQKGTRPPAIIPGSSRPSMGANLPVTVQTAIDFLKAEGKIASDDHLLASESKLSFEQRRLITPDGV